MTHLFLALYANYIIFDEFEISHLEVLMPAWRNGTSRDNTENDVTQVSNASKCDVTIAPRVSEDDVTQVSDSRLHARHVDEYRNQTQVSLLSRHIPMHGELG